MVDAYSQVARRWVTADVPLMGISLTSTRGPAEALMEHGGYADGGELARVAFQ